MNSATVFNVYKNKQPVESFKSVEYAESWSTPTTRLATPKQKQTALVLSLVIALFTAAFIPIASEQWPRFSAFIPAYQTAIIFDYFICAYLIFGHYQATHSRALLHLGCGSLYTAIILVGQFLSFPGMFAPQSLLPGGAQTTIWLWFFWHVGPVAGMAFYAWSEWRTPAYIELTPEKTVIKAIVILVLAVGSSIAAVTVFQDWLPVLDVNGDFSRITSTGIAPLLQGVIFLTLLLLWWKSRFRTVLQVWVGVTLVALFCDNLITMAGGTRLSAGWYIGRLNALLSASVLLLVYLREINLVYLKTVVHARELAASKAKLEIEIDHVRLDSLTQIPGRALFLELAEALVVRCGVEGRSTALLYIDLDGFKAVNDTLGHDRGDVVLVQAAAALRMSLRDADIPGRMGGDEFIAIISAAPNVIEATARGVAKRILDSVSLIPAGIGCSIGIVIGFNEVSQALQQADEAMYEAKRNGKNNYRIYRNANIDNLLVAA
jgi:diguanylate cyclase (GGDEF)-like protein